MVNVIKELQAYWSLLAFSRDRELKTIGEIL